MLVENAIGLKKFEVDILIEAPRLPRVCAPPKPQQFEGFSASRAPQLQPSISKYSHNRYEADILLDPSVYCSHSILDSYQRTLSVEKQNDKQ